MDVTRFYLTLSAAMFSLGALGVLIRRNVIAIFMCIELMLNAANLALVALSSHFATLDGQVYVFFIMAIAAAEASVGLAIILLVFRNYHSVDATEVHELNG